MNYKYFNLSIITIIDYLLVFMVIFAFPLFPFFNSAKFALCISLLRLFFDTDLTKTILKTLSSKKFINFLIIVLFFSTYTLVLTILKKEYDLTLFKKQISSIFYIIFNVIFFIIISKKNRNIDSLIFFAFFLQSIFIILAIISQEFYDLTSQFREEVATHHFDAYGRLRGAAISGYQFFGISTMYGIFILYGIVENKIDSSKKLFMFLLIIVSGIISGRFTIAALILGFFVNFFFNSKIKNQIFLFFKVSLTTIFLSITLHYCYENFLDDNSKDRIDFYLVSPVEAYLYTGEASTTSSDKALSMYKSFNLGNFFTGDGRYVEKNFEGYYGKVDIGYLRMAYYYGIFGLIIIIIIQYILINRLFGYHKDKFFFSLVLFIYFLILNLKGDVFFYSNNTVPLIIGLIYFTSERKFILNDNRLLNIRKNE
jgi:hypothetical protein